MDIIKTVKLRSMLWHVTRYIWASQLAAGRVIDVACGTGYGTALIAGSSNVKSILGIDNSAAAITTSQERYGRHAPRVEFELLDAVHIPGGQTIVCFETIEHLPDPVKFLDRCHRVLDPKGLMLLSAPIDERKDQNIYHLHHFSGPELRDLLYDAGFRIENEWMQIEPESKETCKILNLQLSKRVKE
jgi:2-polyprenyl-3-methyl-5-hydroxy-6-metoxy-1,4-benzoquinol methylase